MKFKNLIIGIFLSIISLLVIIKPAIVLYILVLFVGAYSVVNGITNLIGLKKVSANETYKKAIIIKNLISIGLGIIAVIMPFALLKTVNAIWSIMSYILGIALVAFSVTGFITASMLNSEQTELKKHMTTESLICLLIAVLLFIIPISAVIHTLLRVVGIVCLVVGLGITALEIIKLVQNKKIEKDEIELEAVVVDSKDESVQE